ncbi:hypothetical protein AWV80_13685 [Cupriavidus sp. UYMU48A]|nr:hypothetical protein AWV80_13685 [Cupriavidus sp. UYMU48A]
MYREGVAVARYTTVERPLNQQSLRGVIRGERVRTTTPDVRGTLPPAWSTVSSQPNQVRVSDFTNVSTWQVRLYVAFVIDLVARRSVGLAAQFVDDHGIHSGRT